VSRGGAGDTVGADTAKVEAQYWLARWSVRIVGVRWLRGDGRGSGCCGTSRAGAASSPASQVWRVRYTMPGMCSAETTSYIAHHLQLVGRPDQLFTEDALSLIHNNLALQSLVAAFATGKNLVGDASARAAVSEVVD
jgi:hypothetical protein